MTRRFRWAELQIQALEKRRKRRIGNEDDMKETLKKVPQSLEETYRRIIDSIEADDVPLARDILMIICLSPIALDVNTVAEMVDLDFPDDVLKICTTSLVSVFDDKIQLAHFSVQEFLVISDQGRQLCRCQFSAAEGQRFLAPKTVDCLLQQTDFLSPAKANERLSFLYAAQCWDTHVVALEDIDRSCPDFQAKILRLFVELNVYFNWIRVTSSDRSVWEYDREELLGECEMPITRASSMGLFQTVVLLLNQGADPDGNAQGERKTPLQLSSYHGHRNTVQLLLDRGANVHNGQSKHALHHASYEGHEEIVQLLLDRGADVNAYGPKYSTALQVASFRRHKRIVQMLLDRGADVNAQEGYYGPPLHAALLSGDEDIARMLLDRGADVNANLELYGTALHVASRVGHETTVRMLLDRGADVNAEGLPFGSALQAASYKGNESIVQILLGRGANVNSQRGLFGNALQVASYKGHERIVQILLDQGADTNAEDEINGTALQVASSRGHKRMVQMLLDRGAQ